MDNLIMNKQILQLETIQQTLLLQTQFFYDQWNPLYYIPPGILWLLCLQTLTNLTSKTTTVGIDAGVNGYHWIIYEAG